MPSRSRPPRRLVFGITGHGLGHLTRACQLANALWEIDPELELHFWTDLPRERVASDLSMPFRYREVSYEPGTAQRNCFELDIERTVRDYQSHAGKRRERLAEEIEALRAVRCDAVISDVPALLVRAAAEVGVPAIAVSNFTWDWILEPILEGSPAEPMIELLREDYEGASHHVRLPFGPESSPIASNEPGHLISRRARLEAGEVRSLLGLPIEDQKPMVLVCPGGWDTEGWRSIHPDSEAFDLVLVGDLPVRCRNRDISLPHSLPAPIRFPDLVNAADVVLAKPGYGIASECVAHRTPLVTVDRPEFRETDLLRRELARLGPCMELGLEAFFEGRWAAALEGAMSGSTAWAPLAERPDLEVAAQVLASLGWD